MAFFTTVQMNIPVISESTDGADGHSQLAISPTTLVADSKECRWTTANHDSRERVPALSGLELRGGQERLLQSGNTTGGTTVKLPETSGLTVKPLEAPLPVVPSDGQESDKLQPNGLPANTQQSDSLVSDSGLLQSEGPTQHAYPSEVSQTTAEACVVSTAPSVGLSQDMPPGDPAQQCGTVTQTVLPPGNKVPQTVLPPGNEVQQTVVPPGNGVSQTVLPPGNEVQQTDLGLSGVDLPAQLGGGVSLPVPPGVGPQQTISQSPALPQTVPATTTIPVVCGGLTKEQQEKLWELQKQRQEVEEKQKELDLQEERLEQLQQQELSTQPQYIASDSSTQQSQYVSDNSDLLQYVANDRSVAKQPPYVIGEQQPQYITNDSTQQQYITNDSTQQQQYITNESTQQQQYITNNSTQQSQYITNDSTQQPQYITNDSIQQQQYITNNSTQQSQYITNDSTQQQQYITNNSTQYITNNNISQPQYMTTDSTQLYITNDSTQPQYITGDRSLSQSISHPQSDQFLDNNVCIEVEDIVEAL